MSMTVIQEAIDAAERFTRLAKLARDADKIERDRWKDRMAAHDEGRIPLNQTPWPKAQVHRAAAKRASMDLTRALAEYRRP